MACGPTSTWVVRMQLAQTMRRVDGGVESVAGRGGLVDQARARRRADRGDEQRAARQRLELRPVLHRLAVHQPPRLGAVLLEEAGDLGLAPGVAVDVERFAAESAGADDPDRTYRPHWVLSMWCVATSFGTKPMRTPACFIRRHRFQSPGSPRRQAFTLCGMKDSPVQ
jgi:hypothetical protein